jgi:hypothetical protein
MHEVAGNKTEYLKFFLNIHFKIAAFWNGNYTVCKQMAEIKKISKCHDKLSKVILPNDSWPKQGYMCDTQALRHLRHDEPKT